MITNKNQSMECPHCFLEMQPSLQNNEEVSKCPKCEGLWLAAEIIGNIFDLSTVHDNSRNENKPRENISTNIQSDKDYYYYKKPFTKNSNPDDVICFE